MTKMSRTVAWNYVGAGGNPWGRWESLTMFRFRERLKPPVRLMSLNFMIKRSRSSGLYMIGLRKGSARPSADIWSNPTWQNILNLNLTDWTRMPKAELPSQPLVAESNKSKLKVYFLSCQRVEFLRASEAITVAEGAGQACLRCLRVIQRSWRRWPFRHSSGCPGSSGGI